MLISICACYSTLLILMVVSSVISMVHVLCWLDIVYVLCWLNIVYVFVLAEKILWHAVELNVCLLHS